MRQQADKLFKGRRGARAVALQVLYQLDLRNLDVNTALELLQDRINNTKIDRLFMEELVKGTYKFMKEIDQKIQEAAENWKIHRMSYVDRNILRLAVYEMLYCDEIHPFVSIDEAIELAKSFGDKDSKAFINGILDRIYKLHCS